MNKYSSILISIFIFILVNAVTSAFATTTIYEYDELNRIKRVHTSNGSLMGTITPQSAVTAGAQWQVDGGTWFNSGDTAQSIPVGNHVVIFKGATGWIAPASQPVTITDAHTSTVSGTYVQQTYTVTPSAGAGGSIRPSAAQTVLYYASTSFTVTPNTGYGIASVTGCGGTLSGNTYTTGPITADCSVSAAFSLNTGSLAVTITPPGAVTAGAQWQVDSSGPWFSSGDTARNIPVGNHMVTFKTITGWNAPTGQPVTITRGQTTSASGTYVQQTYTVTPSTGPGGSISPAIAQTVGYGATSSFTVTPNTGYGIASATGCGGTLSGNTYTTGPITGSCGVSVTFASYPVVNTRITGTGYTSLQSAYDAAQDGDTIWTQNVQLTGDFIASRGISVTIVGGYSSDYSAITGMTTIKGTADLSNGTTTLGNFIISN